jgi:glycosyltransferase involved in cell wall biosynthesis
MSGDQREWNNDLGLLIKSEDEESLLEKINYMLDNYENYDRKKIRNYAKDHFSEEVIGGQLAEVYKSVISNSKFQIPKNDK